MTQTLIFVYGQLKSMYSPPQTMTAHAPDYVRGYLWPHEKDDAILTDVDTDAPWVEGEAQVIDSGELPRLDKEEYGAGYDRRQVRLKSGNMAWVYEWSGPVPKGAKPIKDFHEHTA